MLHTKVTLTENRLGEEMKEHAAKQRQCCHVNEN